MLFMMLLLLLLSYGFIVVVPELLCVHCVLSFSPYVDKSGIVFAGVYKLWDDVNYVFIYCAALENTATNNSNCRSKRASKQTE